MWRHFTDPSLGPHERLFFEIYGQALQGRPGTAGLLDDIVDAWVEPVAAYAIERGEPADAARADARLGVAVIARPAARPARDRRIARPSTRRWSATSPSTKPSQR